MNPYYVPPYMQQPVAQPIQQLPQQHMEQKVVSYFVDRAEQLSTINPMPNTIYLGINPKDDKIFMRRMNNDGLMEMKTYSLAVEQTKKTDTQEILERLTNIEKKIGVTNESTNVA
jgi:hypothetical protein